MTTNERLEEDAALALAEVQDPAALLPGAAALRDRGHGERISYSRKVFIPLTQLCRDVCRYCTFAQVPRANRPAYLSPDQVLEIAAAGRRAGCKEALFTLGDRPEARYGAAREALRALGHETTLDYLREMAALVLDETGLLPHINAGVMDAREIAMLREASVSQGLMLESAAERLCDKGGPHFGSPDKRPAARLATIRAAGALSVPFTSGILIGIGETRRERIESLIALRRLNDEHGHLQEIIIQNFRAKPGTPMAGAPVPDLAEHLWTIAVARLLFGPEMSLQAPPNLSPESLEALIAAGIDDWGGISPVTPDHVNPEAAWPTIPELARRSAAAGKRLVERTAVYPRFLRQPARWFDRRLAGPCLAMTDAEGLARTDPWTAGISRESPEIGGAALRSSGIDHALSRARDGDSLSEDEIVQLFSARGGAIGEVCAVADELRRESCGDAVTYVVNRNINYTNICTYGCRFCAFSKGRKATPGREPGYLLDRAEIARRAAEAWARGATEVCLQGGIHPAYTGETYLDICHAVKDAAPGLHIHAFSPLEIWQGAKTLGLPVADFLARLQVAGLGSLPGTAAEVLDDEVRAVLCPDKLSTGQWLEVVETAHRLGLRTTVTVMFGHVDRPDHWARHLHRVRCLQERTGGFTEFVPLPFVAKESPIFLKGAARAGPTFREALLMHAVARLALNPVIANIQTSWVKMGRAGARACLGAGVNDLGGTLMNESITRAAGAAHGQELPAGELEALIIEAGRAPRQRTTLYQEVGANPWRAWPAVGE